MTSFTNWEAKWVSPGFVGTSVVRDCFSDSNHHGILRGGSNRSRDTFSTRSSCTEHSTKAAGGLKEGRTLSQVLRNPEANKKCGTRGQQVLRRETYWNLSTNRSLEILQPVDEFW